MNENLLIYSDNIKGLEYLINLNYTSKIDLIYIDPPFATGLNFKIKNGRASTISTERDGQVAYSDKLKGEDFIESIRKRLILAKKLLSDRGSIYLHTDYRIGHYIKIMMDEVFGIDNFRNDITRIKCNPKNFSRIGYGNIKDMILFYSKGKNPIWNEPFEEYLENDIERLYPKKDSKGRFTTVPIHAPGEVLTNERFKGLLPPKGRHWRTDVKTLEKWDLEGLIEWSSNGNPRKKIYLKDSKGKRMQDIWTYKDPQYPQYPTEKNIDLLNNIIQTSSNEDSIILDFYAGGGTTIKSAINNNRKWIGIDSSSMAIDVIINSITKDNDIFNPSYKLVKLD